MKAINNYFERTSKNPEKIDKYDFFPGGAFMYMDRNEDGQTPKVVGKTFFLLAYNMVLLAGITTGIIKGLEYLTNK